MMDLSALPITQQLVVPESYLDEQGHMNVMWYTCVFSCAAENLFGLVGMDRMYFEANQTGTFALEFHVRYLSEVRAGQAITIRSRLVGRSAKRFHFIQFMTLDATGALAATEEAVGTHINLRIRRSSPMPDFIVQAFDRLLAEHARLPWLPPVCGTMRP